MNEQQPTPSVQMMQMIIGFWTSCCIYTAAKLNIADLLAVKPQTAEELAETTRSHAPSLYRVLRALSGAGIFSENEKKLFSNTPLGATLQSDVPGSMKAMALTQLGNHYNGWGNLLYTIQTGGIAFDKAEGMSIWDYYETHPEDGINFMKAMTGLTDTSIKNILPAYDFTFFQTIVDVGGGNGALLMAILEAAKESKGIVFDLDYAVSETDKEITRKGFAGRCKVEAGSFFDIVPADADAYLMKKVLHDWDDEKSTLILNTCSKAMKPGSVLLVIESVIPEGNTPHPSKFADINMLVMTGGKERTEQEFAVLFSKAGLKLKKVIYTDSPSFSILEVLKQS